MRFITFLIISFFGCVHTVHADHASASFETGSAGAIMTTPGGTLPKGKLVVGASVQYLELDDISDSRLEAAGAADEDVHSVDSFLSVSANLAYGLTDDLTIGLSMPYVDRSNIREAHNDMGVGEAELAGDSNGVGDLTLFGQYRFHQSPVLEKLRVDCSKLNNNRVPVRGILSLVWHITGVGEILVFPAICSTHL